MNTQTTGLPMQLITVDLPHLQSMATTVRQTLIDNHRMCRGAFNAAVKALSDGEPATPQQMETLMRLYRLADNAFYALHEHVYGYSTRSLREGN